MNPDSDRRPTSLTRLGGMLALITGILWTGAPALQAAPESSNQKIPSFRNDILPIFSRAGCSAGACHAKAGGRNGFQLSIFSFDPKSDHREVVREARGRRISPASPDHSLLLLKSTGAIPHEGGKRFEKDSEFYRTLRDWIAAGAPYEGVPELELTGIQVEPSSVQLAPGGSQPLKVTALYSNGEKRDVTHMSEYQSNDDTLATIDHDGRVKTGNLPGEAVMVVRYMDQVNVARIGIPPPHVLPETAYADLPIHNEIDRLVYVKHRELGLLVSEACSDEEFLRRAYLDTLGRLPEPEEVREFLASEDKDKRRKLTDQLLSDDDWADHQAAKWGDLFRPNTQRVGVKPVFLLDRWIRMQLRVGTSYDQFVRQLLTATGSSHEYGPVALMRDKREPAAAGAFVSQIFLGVRLECAQCHHHPSEKWGQEDYYQLAAFFASLGRKGQGISAPISGEPEYWYVRPGGTVKHPVSGEVLPPRPPDGPQLDIPPGSDPRITLVDWMTQPDNPYFARAIVNRIWGEFFGRGIVHPVDDFRASNPPSNEALLDWLATDFVKHGYNLKHLQRRILNSRIYQSSSLPNETNAGDERHFSRSLRRRLRAEQMADLVGHLTGSPESFEGLPKTAPARTVWNTRLDSTFLDTFGRPDSSAECPCERDGSPTIVQSLHLMNSDDLQRRISSDSGRAAQLAQSNKTPEQIVEELYLLAFARFPDAEEVRIATGAFPKEGNRKAAVEDLMWALINSAEFVLNH